MEKYRFDALNLRKGIFKAKNDLGIPTIYKQDVDFTEIGELIPFNVCKDYDGFCHYYIDDYHFERVWNQPKKYLGVMKRYRGVITPDFSLYTNYPKVLNMWQVYRSHWLGAYWQKEGLTVIPNVTWSGRDTFEWCFSGIEKGCIVSVSTVGSGLNIKSERAGFMAGYEAMLDIVKPSGIIAHGIPNDALGDDVFWFDNHFYKKFAELKKQKEAKRVFYPVEQDAFYEEDAKV